MALGFWFAWNERKWKTGIWFIFFGFIIDEWWSIIYLKSVTKSGNIHLLLLASKSRIVPAKKKFAIPKLELLGNFILSDLINVDYNGLSEDVVVANYGFHEFKWKYYVVEWSEIFMWK